MSKKKGKIKGYERLQELAGKAKVELEKILKVISKEADLSSKFMKSKIGVLNIDTEIEKKYRELGKEVYILINDGKIFEPDLKKICENIDNLYNRLDFAKKQINQLKEKMKSTVSAGKVK